MPFTWAEDERNIRYLLQNVKFLEKLHLPVELGWSLGNILSSTARTFKSPWSDINLQNSLVPSTLEKLYEELAAIVGDRKSVV